MGVYNPHSRMWCTVAKCGNGHDDKTIDRLNKELKMKKISKVSYAQNYNYAVPSHTRTTRPSNTNDK